MMIVGTHNNTQNEPDAAALTTTLINPGEAKLPGDTGYYRFVNI